MRRRTITPQRGTDVRPGTDHGTQHHESKRQERQTSHCAAEPEDLAIRNEDDGQVLEDCVGWDGDVLQGLGGGEDHEDEETGDRGPYTRDVSIVKRSGYSVKMGRWWRVYISWPLRC